MKNAKVTKAAGIDQISGKSLKDGAWILSKPINESCNLSMTLGSFPDTCKIAKLKPLFKKGWKTDQSNCRSIFLLSLSKFLLPLLEVFERVSLDQAEEFSSLLVILYDCQSSFRKNHSTGTCLSFLNGNILKGFDDGLVTGMILIDIQKSFDLINDDILLKKQALLVVLIALLNTFNLILSNHNFTVNLENSFSKVSSISCDVPQGSTLGPLLFLICVNDMQMVVTFIMMKYTFYMKIFMNFHWKVYIKL